MRLEGEEKKRPVQRLFVHVRIFLWGKQGNKGLTAAQKPEHLLGQTTLIKFVWLDTEKAAGLKEPPFTLERTQGSI